MSNPALLAAIKADLAARNQSRRGYDTDEIADQFKHLVPITVEAIEQMRRRAVIDVYNIHARKQVTADGLPVWAVIDQQTGRRAHIEILMASAEGIDLYEAYARDSYGDPARADQATEVAMLQECRKARKRLSRRPHASVPSLAGATI